MATNQAGPGEQRTENSFLSDGSRFALWEEGIARELTERVPVELLASWGGRVALGDMLRLDNFNGSLLDIEIEPMEDAFAELAAARQKEGGLAAGNFTKPAADLSDINPAHLRGFWLWATAISSAKEGAVSPVMASVWYHFTPGIERKRPSRLSIDPDGPDIHRFVGNLLTNEAAFREVYERSRRTGTRLLQQGMRSPISVGMGTDGSLYRGDINHRRVEDRESTRRGWHYSDN